MTKWCLHIVFVFFVSSLCAQHENALWFFNEDITIDFKSGEPQYRMSENRIRQYTEGNTVVCDANGDLIFYSDGEAVYNNQHNLIKNGGDLGGNRSTSQGILAIQSPDQKHIYHLLALEHAGPSQTGSLFHSILDMAANNGKGAVTRTKEKIWTGLTEKMIGVNNPCGGTWIVVHERGNNHYLSFLLENDKLRKKPIISPVGTAHLEYSVILGWIGELKISNSNIIASMCGSGLLELLQFDSSSGKISNPLTLYSIHGNGQKVFYSAEFSSNSRYFYTIEDEFNPSVNRIENAIVQYDLSKFDTESILNSRNIVEYLGKLINRNLKRGPDDMIYITGPDPYFSLHRIEKPNLKVSSCNFVLDYLSLNKDLASKNFPQDLIQPIKKEKIQLPDTTVCQSLRIDLDTTNIAAILWQDDYTNLTSRTLTTTGQYHILVEDKQGCAYADTFELAIKQKTIDLPDTTVCSELQVDLSDLNSTITWNDGLSTSKRTLTKPQEYALQMTGRDGCMFSDTFHLSLFPKINDTTYHEITDGQSYLWRDSTYTNAGLYTRTLLDQNGCNAHYVLDLSVTKKELRDPFVPNIFTPNGDNTNDVLHLFTGPNEDRKVSKFIIVDKWGSVVHQQNGLLSPEMITWSGVTKGLPAPTGIYTYYLVLTDDQTSKQFTGSIQLMR